MSLVATIWARKQKLGHGIAKTVLVTLAEHANEKHEAWPAQLTIAEETDFSVRAVRDAMKQLEARGYIQRRKRGSQQRGQIPDLVTLPVGQKVGQEIYRRETPRNSDLPAPHVDLPARGAYEPIKNLYPYQDRALGGDTALPPTRSTHATAYQAAKDGWDDEYPFGRSPS